MASDTVSQTEGNFYTNAREYWAEIPATVDGMLGGYGHVSQVDIQGSRQFLKLIYQGSDPPGKERVLDCGAGIGRISKNLLTTVFDKVDLVEQNGAFLDQARSYLAGKMDRVGEFYPVGLQAFEPGEGRYDVIWAQWVLGHLTESDFIKFLDKCKIALKKNGILVIKENVTSSGHEEIDEKDSSVTRSFQCYMELFEKADVNCFRKMKQTHFPKELYSVYMFALRPKNIIVVEEKSDS